jgi:hypothetical protein
MKKMKTICVLILLVSCISNDKLIVKNISNNDISIKWYYYSYISNISPDFIDVKKGDSLVQIYKAEGVITDVLIENNKIKIKVYNLKNGIIYTDNLLSEVFDYKIELDTTSTRNEFLNRPDAIKE